ncbi:MAG: S1 RNA-binding domain-containing protein [Anaerolineae bacterium]|nr:S1 RNA-binding domain-containing protein [Anaerolineae bacterium]
MTLSTPPVTPPSMQDLLEQEHFGLRTFTRGETVEGKIVAISETEMLVDIGGKSEAVVPQRDLESLDPEFRKELQVGDKVVAVVVRPQTAEGHIVVSLARAELEKDWRAAESLYKSQEVFDGLITGYNKGGLIVRMGKLRGFIPASQLANEHQRKGEDNEQAWADLTGKTLPLKVIELDRRRNRLILSERAALREVRDSQKERLLDSLREGERRKGIVTSVCDFGAFVDLGGADGLIHISELAWGRITHPSEVVKVGQEVEVQVLSVDRERKRIGLSLKRLEPEPWDLVEQRYRVGQLVEGVITKLTSFGAFARIDDQIEGLIHISELSDDRITHPKEIVKEGETHTLRIIRIDSQKRRMGLSLKRVADPQYADIDWREEYSASLQDDWDDDELDDEADDSATAVADEDVEACLSEASNADEDDIPEAEGEEAD